MILCYSCISYKKHVLRSVSNVLSSYVQQDGVGVYELSCDANIAKIGIPASAAAAEQLEAGHCRAHLMGTCKALCCKYHSTRVASVVLPSGFSCFCPVPLLRCCSLCYQC